MAGNDEPNFLFFAKQETPRILFVFFFNVCWYVVLMDSWTRRKHSGRKNGLDRDQKSYI